MKKAGDELPAHYRRSDFPRLVRGTFYKEAAKGTPVVLLEPDLAKASPRSEAVNCALQGLLDLTGRPKEWLAAQRDAVPREAPERSSDRLARRWVAG